ncbi:FkbM family methyltransferase [Phycicoccus flavus]|uniref:FkbM family methyltransferase n=1 Tax=Phycicoccus flavus TaxID=2502783 RepID=UPI000FEC035D|nr:FkbM family methyltransferase [Phycicoccus flavus]NHA69155.1 FkbM family methyltransferase [Phycicoccus flavus]
MTAVLPDFLRYRTADDLVRLGRDNDGGYLVSRADVLASDALVGLGINDDWSFESDFAALRPVPVRAYDGSVSARHFLGRSAAAVYNPWTFIYWVKVFLGHRRFFAGPNEHLERFVGAEDGPRTVSMRRVLADAPPGALFLKVDIEGSEYEILDVIAAAADRTSGLVIELHDCPEHLNEIRSFVEDYPLHLVHVHANNFATVDTLSGMPRVLELTFSTRASRLNSAVLPHELDMPNHAASPDIKLAFGDTSPPSDR